MQLREVVASFEKLWPVADAEDWDVVGLVSGSLDQEIKRIMLTVDVTAEVVAEAKDLNVDLVLSHHPLLLRGVTNVAEESSKGSILRSLIKSDIALYAAHTNADSQATGTSAVLAKALGLADTSVLASTVTGKGIGIIGNLETSLGDLALKLNQILPATATGVRVAGDYSQQVTRVALCAGAGDSYLQLALDSGADVYITSDLRHHPAQEILEQAKARNMPFSLIDISHWAAEFLWLEQAKAELSANGLELIVSDLRTDIFDFLVNTPRSKDAD
jgi:dinuclear metal center YbgI/SA1388 family protein